MTTPAEFATSIAQVSANLDRARIDCQAKLAAVTGSPGARKAKEDAIRAELARYEASSASVLATLRTQAAAAPAQTPAAPIPLSPGDGPGGFGMPLAKAGKSVVQCAPAFFAAAVRAAAYAAGPNTRSASLFDFLCFQNNKLRETILARTDRIAALVKVETDNARWNPDPREENTRMSIAFDDDKSIAPLSDSLALHIPRLESMLAMAGLSMTATLAPLPPSPVGKAPMTTAEYAAAQVGAAGGG